MREEMVPVTILESGPCGTVDSSIVLSLCILLSSHVVYNGADLLDAAHIHRLTALRDLPKIVNTREDDAVEDGIAFREHFPRLSWLLRDCDTPLIDERRHPISATAYLERALKLRGFSEEAEQKNMIRKMIASFFPEQDCHVLPTPAPLPGLPLGERFLRKLETVRASVLAEVPVMHVRGRRVDGPMLQDLAQAYVADANAARPLNIPRACDHMAASRSKLALDRALQLYRGALEDFRVLLPTSDAATMRWHSDSAKRSHKVLTDLVVTDLEELQTQLDTHLAVLQKELVELNEGASRAKATELLEQLFADCERKVRTGEITSLDMFEVERDRVRKHFEARTAGLSHYACRMTMLEFMEKRLWRFSQTLLKTSAQGPPSRLSCGSPASGGSRRSTPNKPPLTSSRSPSCASSSSQRRSPSLPRSMSANAPPGTAEGKWVKREVLEHVKRKAKADLLVGSRRAARSACRACVPCSSSCQPHCSLHYTVHDRLSELCAHTHGACACARAWSARRGGSIVQKPQTPARRPNPKTLNRNWKTSSWPSYWPWKIRPTCSERRAAGTLTLRLRSQKPHRPGYRGARHRPRPVHARRSCRMPHLKHPHWHSSASRRDDCSALLRRRVRLLRRPNTRNVRRRRRSVRCWSVVRP